MQVRALRPLRPRRSSDCRVQSVCPGALVPVFCAAFRQKADVVQIRPIEGEELWSAGVESETGIVDGYTTGKSRDRKIQPVIPGSGEITALKKRREAWSGSATRAFVD